MIAKSVIHIKKAKLEEISDSSHIGLILSTVILSLGELLFSHSRIQVNGTFLYIFCKFTLTVFY